VSLNGSEMSRRNPPAAPSTQVEGALWQDTIRPIIFVGAPRSGTTAIFESFALHPDLAWLSNYSKVLPRMLFTNSVRRLFDNRHWQIRGTKDQFGEYGLIQRLLPRPDEPYAFWSAYLGEEFVYGFMREEKPQGDAARNLRRAFRSIAHYQHRERIAAKLTGPPRIAYLSKIFPEAQFVHIVRDGLAVVRSLLNVDFWKAGGGLERPWWRGGLEESDMKAWVEAGRDPGVLAALQWRRIVESAHQEASALRGNQYLEVRYEDYWESPKRMVARLWQFAGLEHRDVEFPPARSAKYALEWTEEYRNLLIGKMQPEYSRLGYGPQV
jgi:hypothetical protein